MVKTPPRPTAPAELLASQQEWTTRWFEAHSNNRSIDWCPVAARNILKPALFSLTHEKCAYCEAKLGVSSHMEIEHHVAKSVEPLRAFDWTNLFPSCRYCNTSKGRRDHGGTILNPDLVNTEPLLWFDAGTGELQPHPTLTADELSRVQFTIDKLKLNRAGLLSERLGVFNTVRRWIQREALGGPDEHLRIEELQGYLDPKQQFKYVIRFTFNHYLMPGLADEDRRRFGSHP